MKVLLVNGSPHQNGCTYTALSEVADTLNQEGIDTDFYWIGNKPIGCCIGCFQCAKKQKCVFEDKVNEFTACLSVYSLQFMQIHRHASPEQNGQLPGQKGRSPPERHGRRYPMTDYIARFGLEQNPFLKNSKDILLDTSESSEVSTRLGFLSDTKGIGICATAKGYEYYCYMTQRSISIISTSGDLRRWKNLRRKICRSHS